MNSAELDTDRLRDAWGWVEALRRGSSTPWSAWTGAGALRDEPLPGAQQLELLRRINVVSGRPVSTALADRILHAALPGRGRTDLALAGVGTPPSYGPAPVVPDELSADELIRLVSGLIAEDLAAVTDEDLPEGTVRRRRPWAPSYRLEGDGWMLGALRRELYAKGRPEQIRPEVVYVVGADLGTMLTDAWLERVFAESGASWSTWLTRFVDTDRVPRRADLRLPARAWAGRLGRDRVAMVLDPERLARALRLRGHLDPRPRRFDVDAAGAELARRVGPTLAILTGPDRRTTLLREVLLPQLIDLSVDRGRSHRTPFAVPDGAQDWLARHAAVMRSDLRSAGYPVLGSLDRLTDIRAGQGGDPAAGDVLHLALRVLLSTRQVAKGQEMGQGEGS